MSKFALAPLLITLLALPVGAGCKPHKPDIEKARFKKAVRRAAEARRTAESGVEGLEKLTEFRDLPPAIAKTVVARIGRDVITVGDVADYIARQPRHMRARYATNDQREQLLQHMVDFEVLALAGQKKGYDKDSVVEHALKAALAREVLAKEASADVSLADISSADIKTYYDTHAAQFVQPERRRAAIVALVGKVAAEAAHAKIIAAIAARPRLAQQIFADFAKKESVDMDTRHRAGDMGWFDAKGLNLRGQIRASPVIVRATFGLDKLGAVSHVIKMLTGNYAVVQLTQRRPAVVRTLAEVRPSIENVLLRARQIAGRERFIAALREKAKVQIYADKLSLVPSAAGPRTAPTRPRPARAGKARIDIRRIREELRVRPGVRPTPLRRDLGQMHVAPTALRRRLQEERKRDHERDERARKARAATPRSVR